MEVEGAVVKTGLIFTTLVLSGPDPCSLSFAPREMLTPSFALADTLSWALALRAKATAVIHIYLSMFSSI